MVEPETAGLGEVEQRDGSRRPGLLREPEVGEQGAQPAREDVAAGRRPLVLRQVGRRPAEDGERRVVEDVGRRGGARRREREPLPADPNEEGGLTAKRLAAERAQSDRRLDRFAVPARHELAAGHRGAAPDCGFEGVDLGRPRA
jgi:hypothetical protein